MDLGISGLASGFDWRSLVNQLVAAEQAPEQNLRAQQAKINQRSVAYGGINTDLGVLKNQVDSLNAPTLFDSRLTSVSDTTLASATAATGTGLGTYGFNVTQLAKAAVQQGGLGAGATLNPTSNVSALVLSQAGFATAVTGGTFTVNGQQVTIATSDTLQGVFDKINAATSGSVTGSYDPVADQITLSSSSPIVLGSATDTSNFLQVAELYNNGTASVSSASALGSVNLSMTLAKANLATAISDGGAGAGAFNINGVTINFNVSTDTVADVLARITSSTAGVIANFDPVNNRFVITNKSSGDVGIALSDVTGNFLAATKLSTGTLQRGTNLQYTINGGGQLTSLSNTVTGASSGLAGLSVTALKTGAFTVTVGSDTNKIQSAITSFISSYNQVQNNIDTNTASSTDASGNVTAGTLAGEIDANEIASKLRSLTNGQVGGLSSSIDQLAKLGIDSNGNDNTIALTDSSALANALANNLSSVKDFFTHASTGLAAQLDSYLGATAGDSGSIATLRGDLTKQSTDIDQQISDMEKVIQEDRQRMIDSFTAMETAQASINQQLQYLTKQFG